MLDPRNARIAIIGLGYVGLPLAIEFGKRYDTIGYDIDTQRVASLRAGRDCNHESDAAEISAASKLLFTADSLALRDSNTGNAAAMTAPPPQPATTVALSSACGCSRHSPGRHISSGAAAS